VRRAGHEEVLGADELGDRRVGQDVEEHAARDRQPRFAAVVRRARGVGAQDLLQGRLHAGGQRAVRREPVSGPHGLLPVVAEPDVFVADVGERARAGDLGRCGERRHRHELPVSMLGAEDEPRRVVVQARCALHEDVRSVVGQRVLAIEHRHAVRADPVDRQGLGADGGRLAHRRHALGEGREGQVEVGAFDRAAAGEIADERRARRPA
jgi:hypothetical protein